MKRFLLTTGHVLAPCALSLLRGALATAFFFAACAVAELAHAVPRVGAF